MSEFKFIDCQGLSAAGVTLGAAMEGFEVTHRVALPGGFGNQCVEDNRHLLGDFDIETGPEESWTPVRGAYLNGTPPCSGFSVMNTSTGKNARGASSLINMCQEKLVRYAAQCQGQDGKRGPEIVAFESVRAAYSKGRQLMSAYLQMLRDMTGQDYKLFHLLHSDASLNGPQARPRYFWFATRIPFRVFVPEQLLPPSYFDVIGDLEGLECSAAAQTITRPAHPYAKQLYREDGKVTWHTWRRDNEGGMVDRLVAVFNELMVKDCFPEGDHINGAFNIFNDKYGHGPANTAGWWNSHDRSMNFFGCKFRRPHRDRRGAYVIVGGCDQFLHYKEKRLFSIRELLRLMSIPDAWNTDWALKAEHLNRACNYAGLPIGKNCTANAGRWAARLAMFALTNTEPQGGEEWEPVQEGENEFKIDFVNRYKNALWRLERNAA